MIIAAQVPLSVLAVVMLVCPSTSAETHRVMSFNIRGDFDLGKATDKREAWNALSGDHRRDLVLTVIKAYDPDILGVQEAYLNQLDDLQTALPGYGHYGVGRDDGQAAGEQSAIFYRSKRFDRVREGSFWLSDTPSVAGSKHPDAANIRIASWVILVDGASNGREIFVLNTHWDHVSEAARRHAGKLIRRRLPTLAGGRPMIVMGDLNAATEDRAIAELVGRESIDERQLVDSFRTFVPERGPDEATIHNFGGESAGSRIDYIFVVGFRVVDAAIIRAKFDARYPSDHFPVTATLEWEGEAEDGRAAACKP
jgi:endonuclease/exonuclease/phosphatase family metal-dependent hydrolase